MHGVLRHRPSPAMLVALLALFISLGGSAFAALNLPRNSVGTRQLKNGAVTTRKIKRHAVTASKLNLRGVTVPNATDAVNATTAATAGDASQLGGQGPSAYAASSLFGQARAYGPGTATDSSCVLGEIKLFAGTPPVGVVPAAGQLLTISSNPALFTVVGTTYGGDGSTTFALPNLRGAEPKGGGPHGVNYYICTQGLFP